MKKLTPILLLGLAACSNQPAGNKGKEPATESTTETQATKSYPTAVTIRAKGQSMADMTFDTEKIFINKGKTITLTLINEGTNNVMTHNFVVVYNGYAEQVAMNGVKHKDNGYVMPKDPAVIAASPLTSPGQTITFQFTINETGTYQFLCTYPGHWKRMSGYIVVVD